MIDIKMLVSVILPTYNRASKTISAIKSVLSQSAIERIGEIIVIDDGSTDNTADVIEEFIAENMTLLPNITLIKKSNDGAGSARNVGIELSKFPIIAFIDSDDIWLPNKLEEQLAYFDNNEDIDFLGCNAIGSPLALPFIKVNRLYRARFYDMWIKSFPITPSILMKRKIFSEIGGFDEGIKRYEDCDYWQRILLTGYGVYHLQKELVELDNKKLYGEQGLSKDINAIHSDVKKSNRKLLQLGYINYLQYMFLYTYNNMKHIRRCIIVRMRGEK